MELSRSEREVPSRSTYILWAEFLELTGTTEERLREVMDIGWLEPTRTAEQVFLFRQNDVYRMRRLERLCADFELHTLGASIIMDLLDRIDGLEHRLREASAQR